VLLVTAILLTPVALFLLLQWAGASTRHLLYDAAVLAATAAIAWLGSRRAGAPYALLLAGLALLGAWMLVWLKILDHPSGDTVRWLLLAGGAVLLVASGALALAGALGATEMATGVLVSVFGATLAGFSSISGASSSGGSGGVVTTAPAMPQHLGVPHLSGEQTTGWDVYLLIVSLALVWVAARSRARGPGYVGAIGLLLFMISVGAQLTRVATGHATSHSLLGWPLVLVALGLLGLAAPLLGRRRPAS
jgi:hypothetical protein